METVLDVLGLDREDDSIGGTADRIAKMYVSELCFGLSYNRFPKISVFDNKMKYNQMVIQKDITFHSLCEHHFVNFNGMAQVAYIPNEKVIGLSKLNRVVNFFARRPQVQERLNEQIFRALEYVLGTSDIAVLVQAEHLCVKSRGIGDQSSGMTTSKLGGAFFEDARLRNEFMQLAVTR
jgi:GTP cyclohydrolase I